MKLLPCDTCGSRGALLPPNSAFPNGEPAVANRFATEIKCFRCKRVTFISPERYSRLPVLSLEELEKLALSERATKDFEGAGLTKDQAKDLYSAGFRGNEAEMEGR